MSVPSGTRFGPYEIVLPLGAGGMGEVYRARDTRLHRDVALKILPDFLVADPVRKSRFEQEARALAAVSHPNIIVVHDVGDNYLVSELVEGEPLRNLIRRGPIKFRKVAEIAAQIADGLSAAHAARIIHRDIKPENVMIDDHGGIKILDFGIARQEHAPVTPSEATVTEFAATEPGTTVGTASYMSPEQVRSRDLDSRSDIFSLGIVLHEMLSGTQPFAGPSTIETMNAILKDDTPELAADVPPGLANIVYRCLAKDPRDRFQSAGDLAFALRTAAFVNTQHGVPAHALWKPLLRRRSVHLAATGLLVLAGIAAWQFSRSTAERAGSWAVTRLTYDSGLTTDPAISPDGNLIAYASDRAGGSGLDIWVQHAGGGSTVRITASPGDESEPDFLPDGGRLLFRDRSGIYMVPVLGGAPRQVAVSGNRPRASPSGDKFAYWTGTAGAAIITTQPRVYVATLSREGSPVLLSRELYASFPVWSPDGKQILFTARNRQLEYDWYVASADGVSLRALGIAAEFQRRQLDLATSVPGVWRGESVLFAARAPGVGPRIWRMRMSRDGVAGRLEPITNGTGSEDQPAVSGGGTVVISSPVQSADVWSLEADVNSGKANGAPIRITEGPATEWKAGVASNESRIVYASNRSGNEDVWVRDLRTGVDMQITATGVDEEWPAISADGSKVIYRSGPGVYTATVPSGIPKKLCEPCDLMSAFSRDGRYVIANTASQARAFDLVTGAVWTAAAPEAGPVLSPRFAPDTRWIIFHVRTAEETRTIFAAPFHPNAPSPISEWVPITDGTALDRDADWSPDGGLVYFQTDRDGFRCIAAQRVDRNTKRPNGRLFYVQHFHSPSPTMLVFSNTRISAVTVGQKRLFFTLGERTSNLWLMRPR